MEILIFTAVPGSYELLQNQKSSATKIIIIDWQEFEYTRLFGREDVFDKINDYCVEKGISLEIITGSSQQQTLMHDQDNPRYGNLKIIKFPYYGTILGAHAILGHEIFSLEHTDTLFDHYVDNWNLDLQFSFICLNSKPHWHRCTQMDMLAKHDLIKNNAVSWNSWRGYEGRKLEDTFNYPWKYWNPKLLILDDMPEGKLGWSGIFPIHYKRSYAQLVTESSFNQLYISEKCISAIVTNKPFLVSGCQGYHKMLSDYGFELYDEIFDYSFDNVSDMETRYDLIAQNFKNIQKYPLRELKELTKEKTKRNKVHLENFLNDLNSWPPEILDFLEKNKHLELTLNFAYYNAIKIKKIKFIRD